jgi:hypothetical protein
MTAARNPVVSGRIATDQALSAAVVGGAATGRLETTR